MTSHSDTVEYDDDWGALPSTKKHERVPIWPRWIASGGRPERGKDQWLPTCFTRYLERDYACMEGKPWQNRPPVPAPPYELILFPLQRCPGGWLWPQPMLDETLASRSKLHHRLDDVLQSLPALVADADPAIRDRGDWSWAGNERFIRARLRWKPYYRWDENWDHDHCVTCNTTFSLNDADALAAGYAVVDDPKFGDAYNWICARCFDDLKQVFQFQVVED